MAGPIVAHPVAGWDLATLPARNIMVRLHLVTGPIAAESGPPDPAIVQALALQMTAAQCRLLAEDLLRKAELTEARAAGQIQ